MKSDYKETTRKINEVKRNIKDRVIDLSELVEIFNRNGIPAYNTFLYKFAKRCMDNTERGKYIFRNSNPIYYKIVEGIYSEVSKSRRKKEVLEVVNKEQESINYLKSLGYKVFKVAQTLEEV